jgi:hypothetical protein
MTKITYNNKSSIRNIEGSNPENIARAEDFNEIKSSVNDLYDEVGAGADSDNLIVYSINTVGDLASVVDSITDAASDNIYKIEVRPGDYTTTPVIMKPYIYINGVDKAACRFNASTVNDTIFSLVPSCGLENLTVIGATSGEGINFTTASPGFAFANNTTIIDCATGIYFDGGVTGAMEVDNVSLNGTFTKGVHQVAGNLTLKEPAVVGTATISEFIHTDGVNSILTFYNALSFSSNVSIAFSFTNGCRVVGYNGSIVFSNDGMVLSGNDTQVRLKAFNFFNCVNDGVRMDNVGTNVFLSMFATSVEGAGNLNVNFLNPNSSILGNGFSNTGKFFIVDGADLNAYILDDLEGDKGTKFFGELSVGTQLRPSESCFGEGDSHTFLKCYTETSGGVFTDRTAAAISASGSTLTFDGVSANNAIYIANDLFTSLGDHLKFHGIKVSIPTAGVYNYGDIITEYWNGSIWSEFNSATNLGDAPHYKYRKEYFNRTGSFHIKFDPAILEDWTENDPIASGTTRHWMRFRIVNSVTTAPVIEQFKVSTNRSEKNPDGTDEYHGTGRTIKKLTLDSAGPVEGNMQSSNIYVDQNVGVAYSNNRFTTVGDLYGLSFELPEDCDTSGKIILAWKGKFASTGTVQFTVRTTIVKPGDSYTNTEPGISTDVLTYTTDPYVVNAADVREDFRVDLDVSDAIPSRDGGFGDEIWITIQYSNRGAGNFDHTKYSANYLSDFNGRHNNQ